MFWSFLLTTLLYLMVGVACGLCLRVAKKAVNFALPIVYLGYAVLKVVSTDAIASELWGGSDIGAYITLHIYVHIHVHVSITLRQ